MDRTLPATHGLGDPAAIGCPVPCAADENSEKILEGNEEDRSESERQEGTRESNKNPLTSENLFHSTGWGTFMPWGTAYRADAPK